MTQRALNDIELGGGTTPSPLFEVVMLTCGGGCITVKLI